MATRSSSDLIATLGQRCLFPPPTAHLDCAFSGGPDSTALLVLASAAGCHPVAHHVDHGLRPESSDEAAQARRLAEQLGVPFLLHQVEVTDGPNMEARARAARFGVLPSPCATGHTLDDQAETVVINLLRGAGLDGLAAMTPSAEKPLLRLRRAETRELCASLGLDTVRDPSNDDPRFRRNRVRHELLPLLDDVSERDIAPVLARMADVVRDEAALLDELAAGIDATDARALAAAPPAIARRALRRWLTADGYAPDAAGIDRVLAVARGDRRACELPGGLRVSRTGQQLRQIPGPQH
jgi:tRNA(Ile)-lysidine synthase